MKTFHYALGHENFTTMTVAELIAKLGEYPADMPVIGTWETVCVPLKPSRFEIVESFSYGYEADACDVLMIDVDNYD